MVEPKFVHKFIKAGSEGILIKQKDSRLWHPQYPLAHQITNNYYLATSMYVTLFILGDHSFGLPVRFPRNSNVQFEFTH